MENQLFKWENITIDLITGFSKGDKKNDPERVTRLSKSRKGYYRKYYFEVKKKAANTKQQ